MKPSFFFCSLLMIFFAALIFFKPQSSMILAEDEIDLISKQIEELQKARQMSIEATKPLEAELGKLEQKLMATQKAIGQASEHLALLVESIKKREEEFDFNYQLLAKNVENYYKKLRQPAPLYFLLSAQTANWLVKDLSYHGALADEEKKVIAKITSDLLALEKDKKKVEADKLRLSQLQSQLDKEAAFFRQEIKGAKAYQQALSSKIAQLTARQQQLLAQKLASLNLPSSLGAGPLYCTDDRQLEPGFRPAFAFFTYGIPHRVGMNQYGAYGRAKAGQNYRQILEAYFTGISFEKKESNLKIKVQGFGEMPLETYLLGVYEMPADWPLEALKAQAVAARSYALAYTENGQKEICTTQACQVYKGGNKGGAWEQAVRQTEGEVMTYAGQVITAWYASTAGGYTFNSADVGWQERPWTKRLRDTQGEVTHFGELKDRAYDRDSPCFYAAQGWRSEYGKSAWLKSEELADIVNVLTLAKNDNATQPHLSQPDKANPEGVETWDAQRVKEELRKRGLPVFNQINEASVNEWDKNLGKVNRISFSGDGGSVTFEGAEFKNFFNLRAPANIQIVGPLYNVEKK